MKTAESHIKEELGKFVVDLAITKVNHWAKQELNYIRYALDYPVVVPINDTHWVISNYHIKHIGTHRYKVTTDKKEVHTFYSKKAAVFYIVLTKMHYYKTADGIIDKDRIVAKYYDELELYGSKLVNSKKADNFKIQLWQTRYFEVKTQLAAAKIELEKRLNSAKYIKVWNHIL
jgi:hypothetical protein